MPPNLAGCVAGASVPAFVERSGRGTSTPSTTCVAGASVPAFVERGRGRCCPAIRSPVLPGLRSRPLLSVGRPRRQRQDAGRVAGASVPAFVERRAPRPPRDDARSVAGASVPAFVERGFSNYFEHVHHVLPGLRSRPLLSGDPSCFGHVDPAGVAGASVPAFVERLTSKSLFTSVACVAGASVPAFVERPPSSRRRPGAPCVAGASVPAFVERGVVDGLGRLRAVVLPGLRSRPLLSGPQAEGVERARAVLPGLRSRPLLSELRRAQRHAAHERCCRGFGPGLC